MLTGREILGKNSKCCESALQKLKQHANVKKPVPNTKDFGHFF